MYQMLSIVAGGLITIAVAILIEFLRKPKLKLTIEYPPLDTATKGSQNRHLRLILHNEVSETFAPWMQRAPATRCRGEISFYNVVDGQAVFNRSMPVRWANSPEPLEPIDDNFNKEPSGPLLFKFNADSRIDVYPGDEEKLDVAVRFDGEEDCYGWNNDSYLHKWRNPEWKLRQGRYLLRVEIKSAGQKCVGIFRLMNETENINDFRITLALPDDPRRINRNVESH